jgi:hypothetical protein
MPRHYNTKAPTLLMSLWCSTCGQSVRTRVEPDATKWPVHRCADRSIRPFDGEPADPEVVRTMAERQRDDRREAAWEVAS